MRHDRNSIVLMAFAGFFLTSATPVGAQEHSPAACQITVSAFADLGELRDSGSVQIPMEVDLAATPWGGWLVTEDGEPILRYATTGAFEGFFGHLGEGPGELKSPIAVVVDRADSVWVSDARGRVVVFDPSGSPARTIQDRGIFQVHGFTPSGDPYGVLSRFTVAEQDPQGWELARVWSRTGEVLRELGPGAFQVNGRGALARQASPPQSVAVDDTVLLVPRGSEAWLRRWTPTGQETLASANQMWEFLTRKDRTEVPPDGHSIAITRHAEGGFWLLGAIRRLSTVEEERLIAEAPGVTGERLPVFKRRSAPVRNAVYDGVILHVDGDGRVLHGKVIEDYPWGFDGAGRFYSFSEEESGLVKIHLWSLSESCA